MQTTTEIRLDLKYPELTPPVHAKQNDQLTRYIKAYLYDGGTPFVPPGDVLAVVRAKKPDKTVCFYDANEANEPAVVLEENTATVLLAHQVLAAAGTVQMEISLYTPARERLTSFSFVIQVQRSALPEEEILSSDYYNILTEQIAQVLDAAKEVQGAVQEVTDAAGAAQESIRQEGQSQLEAISQAGEQQTAAAKAEADRAKAYADSIDPSQFVKTVNGTLPDEAGNVQVEAGVTSVFGRSGEVAAQAGDYNADQIAETGERVFVSPAQRRRIERQSGENILINWYLANPVNQRGQAAYQDATAVSVPCIDQWWITNRTKASLKEGYLYLQFPAETPGTYIFFQKIESFAAYRGKTLTFSMLFKNLTGRVFLQAQFQPDYTGNVGSTSIAAPGLVSLTFTVPQDAAMLWVVLTASEIVPFTARLGAAKLELGEEQTLARKEGSSWTLLDPAPDPALELAKCQRYYQKISFKSPVLKENTNAGLYSAEALRFWRPMRVKPTASYQTGSGESGIGYYSTHSNTKTIPLSDFTHTDTEQVKPVFTLPDGVTFAAGDFVHGAVTLDAEIY